MVGIIVAGFLAMGATIVACLIMSSREDERWGDK